MRVEHRFKIASIKRQVIVCIFFNGWESMGGAHSDSRYHWKYVTVRQSRAVPVSQICDTMGHLSRGRETANLDVMSHALLRAQLKQKVLWSPHFLPSLMQYGL